MVVGGSLVLRFWPSKHGYSLSAERLVVGEAKDHNESQQRWCPGKQEVGRIERARVLCKFTNSHASWRVRICEPTKQDHVIGIK